MPTLSLEQVTNLPSSRYLLNTYWKYSAAKLYKELGACNVYYYYSLKCGFTSQEDVMNIFKSISIKDFIQQCQPYSTTSSTN
mmetsp:Transcript_25385/g.30736  ORF Transcript_25385/g.30736 Transcript_25385/m.30736 type:complete len:82 (+) Transcript_25385:461-706(+)